MKKFVVIGVSLLAAVAVLAYVFLGDRPADMGDTSHAAPAETRGLSESPAPISSSTAVGEKADPAAKAITGQESWRTTKSGVKTEFYLYKGEIGYVDVDSVVEDRNPYSVVALLQEHDAYTGAGQLLELEIEWVGHHTKSYDVEFLQMIGGIPTEARGSLGFGPSGVVSWVDGDLFDPEAAGVGNIIIQQAEAEAIAQEAAVHFTEPRRGPFIESNESLIVEPEVEELRYSPMTGDASRLRAEWLVAVMTYQPFDDLVVSVDAETGEVIRIESRLKHVRAGPDL